MYAKYDVKFTHQSAWTQKRNELSTRFNQISFENKQRYSNTDIKTCISKYLLWGVNSWSPPHHSFPFASLLVGYVLQPCSYLYLSHSNKKSFCTFIFLFTTRFIIYIFYIKPLFLWLTKYVLNYNKNDEYISSHKLSIISL